MIKDFEVVVENGILTNPGDMHGWVKRAELWYQARGIVCTTHPYFCGPIDRFILQHRRALDLDFIFRGCTRPIVYVGHSNGPAVFCHLMKNLYGKRRIPYDILTAHLFGAAADEDFDKNGLNKALLDDKLDKVVVYSSLNDNILRYGAGITRIFEPIGLGYGKLGQIGPVNLEQAIADRVIRVRRDTYHHTTWMDDNHLDTSLSLTLQGL